ncbi:STAS domain-containing protein [Rhodococcus sp. ACT016]|uniref:STAS domain-containing protein n=1 Tax=Rhodococcus sp. ACT016 TaxID=3134808 RepID=UPI003D29B568
MPGFPISASTRVRRDNQATASEQSTATQPGTALVVEFTANLDLSTLQSFRCAFSNLVDEVTSDGFSTGDLIIVDLSRIDFVSIDATSALVDAKKLVFDRGIDFKLVTSTRGVERALAATGARQLFTCYRTVESAVGTDRTR